MTSRTTTTQVPFSAQQMYQLVADVESYPEFLPWCAALRIVDRDMAGETGHITADMVVAYKVFREQFRSRVALRPMDCEIEADYLNGPFEHLSNRWRFEPQENEGSVVHFFVSFEFRNRVLQSTAQLVFDKAFSRMSEAFVKRAYDLYGERTVAR